MSQLHCYLREGLAERVQRKAQMHQLSVSRYLAYLVEKDVGLQWSDDYFALFGAWQSEGTARRAGGALIRDDDG